MSFGFRQVGLHFLVLDVIGKVKSFRVFALSFLIVLLSPANLFVVHPAV